MIKIIKLNFVLFMIINFLISSLSAKFISNQLNSEISTAEENTDLYKIDQKFIGNWITNENKIDNYLHFYFKDQLNIQLKKLDFKFKEVNLNFDFFIFKNKDQLKEEIKANFNLLGEEQIIDKIEFDKWIKINLDKSILNDQTLLNNLIFNLKFIKLNQYKIFDFNADSYEIREKNPIYIKNLKITFRSNDEERIIDIDDNLFNAIIDNKDISKDKFIYFHFLPKLTNQLKKYYFTFNDESVINWSIKNLDSAKLSDICLKFNYQSTSNSILKLKIQNPDKFNDYYQIYELDSTELKIQNKETNKNSPRFFEINQWKKVSFCLRNLDSKYTILRDHYDLKFEVGIKDEKLNRFKYLAITDIDVIDKPNDGNTRIIKDYLTNWRTNGTFALNEWFFFTEDVRNTITDDDSGIKTTKNLIVHFTIKPYINQKRIAILSEPFIISPSTAFKFDIESKFNTGATVKCSILNSEFFPMYDKLLKIKEGNQTIDFPFTNGIFRALGGKPIIIKIIINYNANDDNIGKRIVIKNLHYSDPCDNENLCNKKGSCHVIKGGESMCICDSDYPGKNCEFQNYCKFNFEPGKNGNLICFSFDTTCEPLTNNKFKCNCKNNFQWNPYTLSCEKISNCLMAFCGKNEVCEEKDGIEAKCRCKKNYYRNEKTGECIYDLCKNLPEEEKCKDYEECVTILGEKKPRCICPLDNKVDDNGNCLPEKSENNPLVKQLHGCEHTYEVRNNKIYCTCYEGYSCKGAGCKECKAEINPLDCKDNGKAGCGLNKICVKVKDKLQCQCVLGFQGVGCKGNFCNRENKNLIRNICGTDYCVEKSRRNSIVSCFCEPRISDSEDSKGLCKLREVCTEDKIKICEKRGAICIPNLENNFFDYKCSCPKYHREDLDENCKNYCNTGNESDEKYKNYCLIDLENEESKYDCDPGFILDKETNTCIAGKNLIKISFLFKYKSLITIESEDEPPVRDYDPDEYYCSNLSYKLDCINKLNENRLKIEQLKKNENDFYLVLKSKLIKSFKESLNLLIDPKQINRTLIYQVSKKGADQINYSNDGLNDIYKIDLLLEIDPELEIKTIKENLKQICLKDEINLIEDDDDDDDNKNKKNDNEDDKNDKNNKLVSTGTSNYDLIEFDSFGRSNSLNILNKKSKKNNNCAIRPYIYLIDSDLNVEQTDLCSLKSIKCKSHSLCEHNRDEATSLSNYKCKCENGYKLIDQEIKNNIVERVCVDIDECSDPKLNNCDPHSTLCENLIGSYRCNCLLNYGKVNGTHCSAICEKKDICKNGECQIFEKHHYICKCKDGYKGDTCALIDDEVVTLRTNLATISIILPLTVMVISVMTHMYIKKVQIENQQKLLKTDPMSISMNDLNSFNNDAYESDNENNKINIKNMRSYSCTVTNNRLSCSIDKID